MIGKKCLAIVLALAMPSDLAWAQDDPSTAATKAEPARQIPIRLDPDAQAAVEGINAFSLDLYRKALKPGENLFISPASVSVALGLAYRGASGTTEEELRQVMHFTSPPEQYLQINSAVLESMNFKQAGRELATANAIWLDKAVSLKPDYRADVTVHAKAGIHQADFQNAYEPTRIEINRWVEGVTHDRIKDLLAPGDVKEDTRAVLVNAIYWKGEWKAPFWEQATMHEPFTKLDGGAQETRLMHRSASFQVTEREGVKAILLPYRGEEMDMAIFLPNSPKDLPAFEARLDQKELNRWLTDLRGQPFRNTILTLPRMYLEWRGDLRGTLEQMGLKAPFEPDADFSRIAEPLEDGVLGFKKIIHKTFLDVEEKGAEAAAATATTIIIVTSAPAGPPPPPPFVFRADKPFLFLLRDRRSGLIVFMGRYVAPE